MVYLTQLWLPIVVAAVIVFVASSIIHMVLPYHRSDYKKLPEEDKVLEAMRAAGVTPGTYHFPHCDSPKDLQKPEVAEKYKKGPTGILSIMPSGIPSMGKFLGQWFVFCVFISFMVAYLTGRTCAPGTDYLHVFRVAGTAGFLGYAGAQITDSIWKGQPWSTTAKHVFDGLIYGLLTAGTFGWLWPR